MAKLSIALFEILEEEKKYFKEKLKGQKLTFFEEPIQNIHVSKLKNFDIFSVFIYSKVSEFILTKCPNIKAIITRSTGFDHIDIKYCIKNNIQISNVPFYGENTVAEHGFALLLNLSRNIHKSYVRCLNKDYSIKGLRGFDLRGKTLGVIGVGHIGLHLIRMAKGFSMNVKAFDTHKNDFLSEVLDFQYEELDEILKTSDIISLHMPFNKNTKHFINKERIKMMKKGVIIINTARGGLIDTKALYFGLKNGQIGGCGLDVIEGEEFIMHEDELLKDGNVNREKLQDLFLDKEILEMNNVIFTPHNAFNSEEAIKRIQDTAIENILSFIEKKNLKNLIPNFFKN